MNKKDRVKNYVISIIIGKQVQMGQMIPSENYLSKLFKISRNPVREALKELSYSNWLQPIKGVGYFVQGFGSYDSQYAKGAYKLNVTKIRSLREDEKKFLTLIDNNKLNNKKFFVKEYFNNKMLVIKSINLVSNDYLFYLSTKEIEMGFIQGLLKHKIAITHQDRWIQIIDIKDQDSKKLNWEGHYPVIITALYNQEKLIEKSLVIIRMEHFAFQKKVVF